MLPAFGALIFLSFSEKENKDLVQVTAIDNCSISYNMQPVQDLVDAPEISLPLLQKKYTGFKEAVGFKESRGNYATVNKFGYMGKYQFGKGTLALIGIYNMNDFLHNPELQEAAFYANASRNKWILQRDIKRFSGKTINGVKITESGILAAAHLAGPGSVKKYLRSNGKLAFSDAFGTSIKHYLYKFEGYDVSYIKPNRKAKAKISKKV